MLVMVPFGVNVGLGGNGGREGGEGDGDELHSEGGLVWMFCEIEDV